MTIRYECKECGAKLNIKDEKAGTAGHCPKCAAEFTVPAPQNVADAGGSGATSAPAAAKSSDGFDDDDIDKILSDESPAAGTAVAGGGDSGGDESDDEYGVASAGVPSQLDDDDADDEKKKATAKKKARSREEEERIADAATVARALMGRGDKADKGNEADQPEKKRLRNLFGASSRDEEDEEGYSTAEVVKYFAVKGAGPIAGVLLFAFGLYWLASSMMGGFDTPPVGRVTGNVTLDGQPLGGALVTFSPMSEELNKEIKAASSSAYTDPSGNYDLKYSADVSGAAVGKHYVTISAIDPLTGVERVPTTFNGGTSTLTEQVKAGSQTINFALKSAAGGK